MTEREFQISFERQLQTIIPGYNIKIKLTSDVIFYYINRAKDEYIKQLYRLFQQNQEITDRLRTLVKKDIMQGINFNREDNRWIADYPEDYVHALGEEVYITIRKNKCPNLITKAKDVIEATIDTVDRILENSLSEYHLHYNQARPIRLYTENSIVLITDGNYDIDEYRLTYLRNGYDLGNDLMTEYKDLPEVDHQEIVDTAVRLYLSEATSTRQSERSDE